AYDDTFGPSVSGEQLFGASANLSLDPLFKIQLYALARVSRYNGSGSDRSLAQTHAVGETYTGSLRVYGDSKGFRYGVEAAYQLGNVESIRVNGTSADRAAYAAAFHVSKTFDRLLLTPTFRLGGSLASGDDGTGAYKQFDPILPDVHAFHGA